MTERTRRKVLLGAAALVGAGFLGDLLFVRPGPAVARAADFASGGATQIMLLPEIPLPPVDEAIAWLSPPDVSDAEPVPEYANPVFSDPPAALAEKEESAGEAPESPVAPDPPASFEERHTLTGIVWGRRPLAIIDGQRCGHGTVIDAHRITRIEPRRVVLYGDSGYVELRLAAPSLP